MLHGIAFRNLETGHISYYTGKAGGDWLSPNAADCFFAYALKGVEYIGRKMLNQHNITLANHELLPVAHPIGSDDTEGGACD